MANRPLLRSRLVAALAKRTLLASSSASLRSSTVRSGALLNINKLVYIAESDPANPPHTALARRLLPATRWGGKPPVGGSQHPATLPGTAPFDVLPGSLTAPERLLLG